MVCLSYLTHWGRQHSSGTWMGLQHRPTFWIYSKSLFYGWQLMHFNKQGKSVVLRRQAQNPLHQFPHDFPGNKSLYWNLGNDTTQQTQRTLPAPTCYRLVADLLRGSRQLVTEYGFVTAAIVAVLVRHDMHGFVCPIQCITLDRI